MTDKPSTDADPVKDAFRAALERKRGQKHPHEADGQGNSKVHSEHGASGGKREFRRKSGG
jgi:hypothetical protein